MNVTFFLKDRNKEISSLRAVVRYNGQRYQFAVRESVVTKFWNSNKYRCRITRDYSNGANINNRLDIWENIIEEAINSFGVITPTQQMFTAKVKELLNNRNVEVGGVSECEEEQFLVPFIQKYKNETVKSHSTLAFYQLVVKKLAMFEKENHIKLRFADIDVNFYNKFYSWLLQQTPIRKEKGVQYSKNYICKIINAIVKFMNVSYGTNHKFISYKKIDIKRKEEVAESIYLTEEEIQRIYDLEITSELLKSNGYKTHNMKLTVKAMNEEKDKFLIGCYTGLRQSDYSRLEALHFRDNIIRIWTKKKDKKVYIPMHHKLKAILERRKNILPKKTSDVRHNRRIKIIGMLAGINDEVVLTKTRGTQRVSEMKKKYEFMTSHTARRSASTNMYLAGIDIKFIQGVLGHSKIEQTISYIKVSAEENAKRLLTHPYFSGEY